MFVSNSKVKTKTYSDEVSAVPIVVEVCCYEGLEATFDLNA